MFWVSDPYHIRVPINSSVKNDVLLFHKELTIWDKRHIQVEWDYLENYKHINSYSLSYRGRISQ